MIYEFQVKNYNCTIFVDTNVIIECYRIGAWRALTGGHEVETVEECIMETQTGKHHQQINETELRTSLASVHSVEVQDRAHFDLKFKRYNLSWMRVNKHFGHTYKIDLIVGCYVGQTKQVCTAE